MNTASFEHIQSTALAIFLRPPIVSADKMIQYFRLEDSGVDSIDAKALRPILQSCCLSKSQYRMLGGYVHSVLRKSY